MNTFCLVGQLDELPELHELSNGTKQATLMLKVLRPYKDVDGCYHYDYIPVEVWRGLAETLARSSKQDDWLSVKGRIKTNSYTRNNKTYTNYTFVAETIGFIH
jgi:single-strand DNA-binding protein